MAKNTPTFIFEAEILALPGSSGFDALETSSNFSRKLYNAVLGKLLEFLKKMRKNPEYQAALALPKTKNGETNQERLQAFSALRYSYGLSKYQAASLASSLRTGSVDFDLYIPSKVAQEVGKRAYSAVEKKMYGKAKRCRFKKKSEGFSMRGSSNKEAPQIKFTDDGGFLVFRKTKYALISEKSPKYFKHAASCPIKNSVVFNRIIKDEIRWFVQISLEGLPFKDVKKEIKHQKLLTERFGSGFKTQSVSVDFGPSAIAISNEKFSYERKIVGKELNNMLLKSKKLQRQMSRSLHLNNKKTFQSGALKKGARLVRTKNYEKLRSERADIERRIAAFRKTIHGNIAGEVCALGTVLKIEDISYKALQKRYGRSVGKAAPASLKASLSRTAEKLGGSAELINTFHTKLSQTCLCGAIKKKKLSERVHSCESCGLTVPRDTLSAFLGCFTTNIMSKKGKIKIWISRLDLPLARTFASGHQTLSSFVEADFMSESA